VPTPAHLPTPPKGRTIVIGAGKASAAIARVNEIKPDRGSAHFSDRGHLFQVDRGRRFRAIVDAQGMRASEYLMYFNHQTCFRTSVAKRFG